ncbi:hypothetical protein JCM6882_002273 [Rhodosporidiobolus microsporus]
MTGSTAPDADAVTIASLPPELLTDIFSHLYTTLEPDLDSLKSATLVCSSWRDSAQRLVWAAGAELQDENDLSLYVSSAGRRRGGPKEIAVHGYKETGTLERLFGVCGGLRWLMINLSSEQRFEPETLARPEMADLRTLIVQASLLPISPETTFPFTSLRTLVLADLSFRSPHLSTLLTSLHSSGLPSLRSISLPNFSPSANSAIAEALLLFAPQLDHLGLSIPSLNTYAKPFLPVLAAATRLSTFECTALPFNLLAVLPPSLTVLATKEDAPNLDAERLAETFERLKDLKRLYFALSRFDFLQQVKGARRLLEAMDLRGVDWRFEGEEEEDGGE